jgi:hypothetical protein
VIEAHAAQDARRAELRTAVSGLRSRVRGADPVVFFARAGSGSLVLGLGLIYLGWQGASHSVREVEQIPYLISGGILGLALVFLGGLMLATVLWASLLARMLDGRADAQQPTSATPLTRLPLSAPGMVPATAPLVATVSGTLYHRPGCRMVAGRKVVPAETSSATAPCQVCDPAPLIRAARPPRPKRS